MAPATSLRGARDKIAEQFCAGATKQPACDRTTVMPVLVAGIHVSLPLRQAKTWMAGHRRVETTPFFERLCPAMMSTCAGMSPHPRDNPARVLQIHAPNRGRRECRTLDAPAAARGVVVDTRVSHHGHTGFIRHSPRNGVTVSFVISPAIGLSCHRPRRNAKHCRQVDASVEASGPHDFTVRQSITRQLTGPASIASRAQRP
jgi:hypothetical protein